MPITRGWLLVYQYALASQKAWVLAPATNNKCAVYSKFPKAEDLLNWAEARDPVSWFANR